MYIFIGCKSIGRKYEKPTDIIVSGSIIKIDYTFDCMVWIKHFDMVLYAIATDENENIYHVFRNADRNLYTAIPEQNIAEDPETDSNSLENALQWVADVYHCSDIWGQVITNYEMLLCLTESEKQKFPGDYSPDPSLYRQCCKYWNQLAELYPN